MGLHMLQLSSMRGGKGLQSANFILDIGFYFLRRAGHIFSAKPHQVRKARMGANRCAKLYSMGHRTLHNQGVTCVKTTGNIG
jgi:hypothetical protein